MKKLLENETYDIETSTYKIGDTIDDDFIVLDVLGSNGLGLVTYLVEMLTGKDRGNTTEIQRQNERV